MRFKIFRRKKQPKVQKPRFHQGSYSHLRSKPKKNINNIIQAKAPKKKDKIVRTKFRFASLLLLPVSALLLGIGYIIFFSDFFIIENIEIKSEDSRGIERIRIAFEGNNILFTSIYEIENVARETIPYTDNIFARKVYPNKIEIEILSRTPSVFYLDFQKYALLDNNYEVIELGSIPAPLDLSEQERGWVEGELTVDSEYIQKRYIENLEEDEISDFNWEEVSLEEKEEILNAIVSEAELKIEEYFQTRSAFLKENFGDYPVVKFYEFAYDEDVEDRFLDLEVIDNIISQVNTETVIVEDVRWVNYIRIEIYTSNEKVLIFGGLNEEEILKQIDRYLTISKTSQYNQYRIFDFRTENFTGTN